MGNGTEWEEWSEDLIQKVDVALTKLDLCPEAYAELMKMVRKAVEDRREYWAEYAEMAWHAEQEA